ncbi:sodium:calcium antiporter [Nannocystis pusilla]|uniref:Sodium/calcium exchanger membrane region domain-containing protein n=1 Tax=Nannocystis pusilla TaxID=889268 RepID=A0ABS7U557_9BACT|nr:hypothetical protein [Nannocystis pusilla]MBZ5715694.1 hypothetical protein [Nannocystis pusilla]
MFDFSAYPLWLLVTLFVVGGLLVWFAGTRLARLADAIAERTGVGRAFIGALLLGGLTSLPEVATSVTSTLVGNVRLAVNNILGGVAMQVALLAIADAAVRDVTLSIASNLAVIRLQAALLILALIFVAMGIVVGEPAGWSVGPWSMGLFAASAAAFYAIRKIKTPDDGATSDSGADSDETSPSTAPQSSQPRHLVLKTVVAGLVVLVAGAVVGLAGDALGRRTGLGSSFVGVLLVALTTSLPELSTTVEAARLGRYQMAFSNVLGTNFFDIALIFVIDLLWREGPALDEVGRFSTVAALLGAALTGIYLLTFATGRRRRVLRVGTDSLFVLLVYVGGMFLLYWIRGS